MVDHPVDAQSPIRPRDVALWLLASKAVTPRKRARSQHADIAGLELKREVLQRLAVLDPAPQNLDKALQQIVADIGPPTGPTRAVAETIRSDWEAACRDSEFIEYLLAEAAQERGKKGAQH